MQPLLVIGAGGFGREVLAIIEAINCDKPTFELVGVADDSPTGQNVKELSKLDVPWIGSVMTAFDVTSPDTRFVLGIGSNTARKSVVMRLAGLGRDPATLVHPASTLGSRVFISPGCVVAAGARLSTNIRVGPHVHLDQNSVVAHDSRIDAFARINPQACVSGNVTVEAGATVGANATILQGVRVGRWSTVGAGAVVTRDVPPKTTVKGVPAG